MANAIEIKINNNDGTSTILERKDCVKYLGVLIDDKISWNSHISYICSRISKNTGILYKLRNYLSLQQLKQLYYSLIYPYITYVIVAWGSTYQTHLKKIQIKQNHLIRLIFFATLYGKNTESALPLLNLLDFLTVNNIYRQQTLKFIYQWHIKCLPEVFASYFTYSSDVHSYNTRYAAQHNLYQTRSRTNTGKQMISAKAVKLWHELPIKIKKQNMNTFPKNLKQYLLQNQC